MFANAPTAKEPLINKLKGALRSGVMDMFAALLQIKNYKLFVANMFLLGMGIAVTVPYLVLFATKDLGMTTNQYGLLLASAAISQFTVNSIIARFSDTHHFNRKIIIILEIGRAHV